MNAPLRSSPVPVPSARTRRAAKASRFGSAALTLAALTAATAHAQGPSLPPDFIVEDVSGTWVQPTKLCFAGSDDLLVAEKSGLLWDVRRGVKHLKPVIDLQQEILNNGDRGLLSVAVDDEWATDGYIYLLYIVDPNQDFNDSEQESFGRLTRYTTHVDVNGDLLADPASRTVLIGATWPEGIPSIHLSHSVGDLRFATDGSLLISTGDGAHYDLTDIGGNDPNGFGSGKFPPSEDIGAFRSQSPTSLAGKILRIDPATGLGLPDNPLYTGNPADNQSRVWAMGLRNPFRFCLKPDSGLIERAFIGDVGWNTWEEINSCYGAEDFGWPCWEGPNVQSSYDNADPSGWCNDPTIFSKPLWSWHHSDPKDRGFTGQCTAGMQVYTGTEYPQNYVGKLFFADYASDWIRTVRFVNGQPTENELFGTNLGHPVDIEVEPAHGDLYYIGISSNVIRHIRYTKANHPPVLVASIDPVWGSAPLTVNLDASGSFDPEGGALTFDWDLGDGNHSNTPTATYTYANAQNYNVVLTITDSGGEVATKKQLVSAGNTPPVITAIRSPAPGSFFTLGQTLTFDASASDAEDDPAGVPLTATWVVDLIHDHHVHPGWATLSGFTATYAPENHGDGTYLHVTLNVTDSRGLVASQGFDLYDANNKPAPHLVELSNFTPRLGNEVKATGHVHYAGLGNARLDFDWGDGTVDTFHPTHLVDCKPRHTYAAPGFYTLRLTASDNGSSNTATQVVFVRPLAPAVAIFAPLVAEHWMKADEQWAVASTLASDLHAAGFEADVYSAGDQDRLKDWLRDYKVDSQRDYLVCLDSVPAAVYAGQDDGSLAEQWLDSGNGVLWTGYNPFARYIGIDGSDDNQGSGQYAADEILNAAVPQLCSATAHMDLTGDAGDLPALQPFNALRGLLTANLNPSWTPTRIYASDGASPPASDALVLGNGNGGEYAQFYTTKGSGFPREAVIRDFFLSHVYHDLPPGPGTFALLLPASHQSDVPRQPTLTWQAQNGATSWLVEVAADVDFTTPAFTATVTGAPQVQVDHELKLGKHYFWRVTARNDYGTRTSEVRGFRVTENGVRRKKP